MVEVTEDDFVKLRSLRFHVDRLKQLKDTLPIMVHPELLDDAITQEEHKIKELENGLQERNLQIKSWFK